MKLIERKSVRFYDTSNDRQALEALKHFKDYGFESENAMMVSALYKFIEHGSSDQTNFNPEELASLIAEQLKGKLQVTTDMVSNTDNNDSSDTSSSIVEMGITDAQDDDALAFANDFMNSL